MENKSRRLTERLVAAEAEKEDLRRQLAEERKDTNRACAKAQAAQAEAKLAWAESSLARQRAEEMETRLCGLRDHLDKSGGLYVRGDRPDARAARGRVPGTWCADRSL